MARHIATLKRPYSVAIIYQHRPQVTHIGYLVEPHHRAINLSLAKQFQSVGM